MIMFLLNLVAFLSISGLCVFCVVSNSFDRKHEKLHLHNRRHKGVTVDGDDKEENV